MAARRLLPLLVAAGCAHSLVRTDIHQRGWLLVETAHISLRTDLGRDDAVAHALELDRYWAALAHLYGLVAPGSPPPARRFQVIHLDSCGDFERIRSGDVAGFVFGSFEGEVAVTCEDRGGTTLVHELAHIFNHHHFAYTPRWVDEGLATYYGTLEVRGGRAILGNFPSALSDFWNHPRWLPNLDAIRHMDAAGFYDPMSMGRNYFAAWKLVHLLNNGDRERQHRFRAYLAALHGGTPDEQAWQAAFAGDGSLADDYITYQQRDRLNRLVTGYRWEEPAAPRVRRLRPGEAHVLWASLLTVEHADQVAAQLERAARADPRWPRLLYWRARLLRPRDEVDLLRRYLRQRPDDAEGWLALVSARLRRAVPERHDPLSDPPTPALADMQADIRKLVEHSSDPTALNQIGWYYALARNPNAGLNFAIRSVRAEPSCGACWDTVAVLYFQAGKLVLALAAEERAAGIYAERAPPDVTARVRLFRAAVRRTQPGGSAR